MNHAPFVFRSELNECIGHPEGLADRIRTEFPDLLLVDGQQLAMDAGNPRVANTVLLGAVSKRIDIAEDYWLKALEKLVPKKALEINLQAFRKGRML